MRHRHPFASAPLTLAAVLSLLLSLGWLAAPAPTAAQDDEEFADAGVDGDFYESPTFGYTLEWDADVWIVEDAVSDDDGDYLHLNSGPSDLYFESLEDFDGDIVDCLDTATSEIEDDDRVSDFEPLLDEDDEPSAFAAFSYTATIDGDDLAITQYTECRVLVPDVTVLQIDHLAPQDDYEAESALVADILDTLTVPGAEEDEDVTEPTEEADEEETPDSDQASPPAEDVEATPEDDTATDDDADPTEATEDDADAEPTEEPTDSDEPADEDPTDESEDEADDAEPTEEPAEEVDPDDLEGVDDDTYTSPTYGYSLEWDGDVWSARAATAEDDVDTLVLTDDASTLTLIGTAEFGENLDRCVRTARRDLEAGEGVEDVTATLGGDGEPIEIDEDDRAGAVYSIFLDDDPDSPPDQVAQIECRVAVPGEAVIQIIQVTEAADFNTEIEPVRTVLDSITLEDEEPAEEDETPTPEDEPTPDDEETDDEESAVDGNTYVSPNFGYSLEWDEDVWEFNPDNPDDEDSAAGFDTLFLSSANSALLIIGTSDFTDPEECVDNFASFLRMEPDVDNWAPLEDDDGERIEGERDGGYFAAFSLTIQQSGQEFDVIYYFECRTIIEGESVVLFSLNTGPDAYDDATAELDDLLETLTLPDADESDDPEPTPEDEDQDQDPDPTPTDEDQEEDADPTPDNNEDQDDEAASNADLDTYTDPDFPFSVTWDEGIWSVIDQRTVGDGHNLLSLQAEGSDLTIEGWARWDGVPTDCLNDITTNLRALDGVEDFQRVSDSDLYPENSSSRGANALYSFTLAPEGRTPVDYYGYVECRTVVEGEAVVVLTLIVPADEYEALRPDFEPILASIEIDEP